MARRALVLGSQIEGLRGVDNDCRRMAAMLEARGFAVDLRIGDAATRDGMLAGYDRLIAASGPDDAAAVYYCGHGYHARVAEEGRSWQCITPTDLRAGSATDWRGITAWELSIKQAQLTDRTRNVTVILDCCHSARLSRSDGVEGAVPRALPHPVEGGFERHLAALRARYGADADAVHPVGNPHAVRVVACGQSESAFEYPDAAGVYHGAFTDVLIDILAEVGASPVSWGAIIGAIRARVLRRFVRQRPDLEGPARRGLFSLSEHDDRHRVAVTAEGEHYRLAAGRLTGAAVGDVYCVQPTNTPAGSQAPSAVARDCQNVPAADAAGPSGSDVQAAGPPAAHAAMPAGLSGLSAGVQPATVAVASGSQVMFAGPPTANERGALTELEVVEVFSTTARAHRIAGAARIPAEAVAVRSRRSAPRWPVAIDGADAATRLVEDALAASSTLRTAVPGELGAVATLRVAGDAVTLEDAGGPLSPAVRFPMELDRVLAQAAHLGVAQGIRELEGEHGVRASELAIELGAVRDGRRWRLREHGAVFGLGDRYYVHLESQTQRTLFVHLFSLSARGKITLLTHFARSGVGLDPREPLVTIGQRADGALVGVGLRWPEGLPRDGLPRLTELVVIATRARMDLSGLETHEHVLRGGPASSALAELCDRSSRGQSGGELEAFFVKRLSMLLDPAPPERSR